MNNNNDNDSSGFADALKSLLQKFLNLPLSVKAFILSCILTIILIFVSLFIIVSIVVKPTDVTEDYKQEMNGTSSGTSSITEMLGNLFSGNGFNTDEDAAINAEKAYFAKLKSVSDSYQKKGITIDITMITATLFYNRTFGDYIYNDADEDTDSTEFDESQINLGNITYDDSIDFYKQAKKSISTLAKYQVLETRTVEYCEGDKTDDNYSSMKEFAESGNDYMTVYKKIDLSDDGTCNAKTSTSYSIDISREGLYYYRLVSPVKIGVFSKEVRFIKDYYYPNDNGVTYENMIDDVEEIYRLYETVAENSDTYCYTPSTSTGSATSSSTSTSTSSESREAFISSIASDAVNNMTNSGILASVTLAQAAVESRNGSSGLSSKYNNYYGMTAGSCAPSRLSHSATTLVPRGTSGNGCNGNAYWNGDVVWMCNSSGNDCQWYRVYDGFSNSTLDHSRLLSNSHYSCQGLSTPDATLSCVVGGGYATDPNYKTTMLSIISTYNLTQYDIGEWNGEVVKTDGSVGLGTICINASAGGVVSGAGTLNNGTLQGIRTSLYGTAEYNTFWHSTNNLFYASNPKLEKQCTWYAHGRALEILIKNGMGLAKAQQYLSPMHGNAGTWFSSNKYFTSSSDVTKPRVGAIIVWSNSAGAKYGHVAIIEDIKYDASGNPISITTTEGGTSIDGFKYTEGRTISYISSHSTYRFVGYVYLLG